MESLSPTDQIAERLIMTDIQQDVNVVFVLEVAVKAHNVFMVKGTMDLNFRGELLSGLAAGQILL